MDKRTVRLVGAGWLVLAAVALLCFWSFAVADWNDMCGDQTARWAGPGNLTWGLILALLTGGLMAGAMGVAVGTRLLPRLTVVVVALAFVGPMAATQVSIEHRRNGPTLAEQDAAFEREMAQKNGSFAQPPPAASGIQGVFDSLPHPAPEGLVLEMTDAALSVRYSTPEPEDVLATLTEELNAAGWAVSMDPAQRHLTASRASYSLDVRSAYEPAQLGPDEEVTPGYEGPWFTVVRLVGIQS